MTTTHELPTPAKIRSAALSAAEAARAGRAIVVEGPAATMVARRLQDLLDPDPRAREALAWLYTGAGMRDRIPTGDRLHLRAPHHTATKAAICGQVRRHKYGPRGGTVRDRRVIPGELSLAHGGVLLLDSAADLRVGVWAVILRALATGQVQHRLGEGETVILPARPAAVVIGLSDPLERQALERRVRRSIGELLGPHTTICV